ncbi:MAG: hypothetical protein AB1715_07150 [Acidobacteriota bacterium]
MAVGVFPLFLTLSLLSQTTRSIEKAFFQDDPRILCDLFSRQNHLYLSLPEPFLFADQLSPEQAYFFFRRVYLDYSTFEFYSDAELPLLSRGRSVFFRARWSFKHKRSGNQYVLQVFFRLVGEPAGSGQDSRNPWRISEIKAEKL